MKKLLLLVLCAALAWSAAPLRADEPASQPSVNGLFEAEAYLAHVKYLASDELEGRLTGTPGIEKAGEYIARHFKDYGLKPGGEDGTWFQGFEVHRGKQLVDADARLAVEGVSQEWEVRKDWIPLPFSSLEDVEAPLAFAGYGIEAPAHEYDDYTGFDATGKVLLMFRYEPRAANDDAEFGGRTPSRHALFARKTEIAARHGAKAVLIVNPPKRESSDDTLFPFDDYYTDQTYELPIAHVARPVAEALLKKAGLGGLAELQDKLDQERKPLSADLKLTVTLKTGVKAKVVPARNVLGLIQGTGPTDETIVIGAHYDHLGILPSSDDERTPQIHNGADDNASGTAGVLELARVLARERGLRRNLLLIAFSGEELGLLGSKHFVEHPTVPLTSIRAMVNFDMIGRLDLNKFTIYGVKSATEFPDLVQRAAEHAGVKCRSAGGGGGLFGSSDQASFYEKDIPVLFAFTGIHKQYHRPTDDWELIDAPGATRVLATCHELIRALANLEDGPTFQSVTHAAEEEEKDEEPPVKPGVEHAKETPPAESQNATDHGGEVGRRSRPRIRLGITPDFGASEQPGVVVSSVSPDTPAHAAGIQAGDRIIRIADRTVKDMYGYMAALREATAGETVEIVVVRQGEDVTLKITLPEPPKRRGQE
jgi:hypothetical protein